MSVETRRKQREPKTDTEKLLQKEKAKAGLQALAIGPVTGVLGLPSDILDLADMANDAVAKYGEDTVLGQFSKLIKPKLDEVQEKYGREAFDRGFTELTGIKSDITNPPQMLGELISLGTLAKTGIKGAKLVGETLSDTYKGTKKLFEDSTIPPAGGPRLATVDDAPLPEIKETETLLQKPEKVDTTLKTPTVEDYANLPVINPSVIGLQTELGKRQAKKFFDLEKNTNKSPEEIFAETGVYRGPDKKLRYELDDRGAKLTKTIKKEFKNFNSEALKKLSVGTVKEFRLEQIFDFDALYKQYDKGILQNNVMYKPIKDLKVEFRKAFMDFDTLGGYDPIEDTIVINLNATAFKVDFSKAKSMTPKDAQAKIESTILHEIQHAIQFREGFFTGGNSRDRLNKINPNHKQDSDTNRALIDKARERLKKIDKDARFPIENFINEKVRLEKQAKKGEKIGEYAKSYLETLKNKVDELEIPKSAKTKYAKDYQNYRKNKDTLDDQSRKAYKEYRDLYGEREARLIEDRYQKRKEILDKEGTLVKKLFRGKQDDVDTSLRGDTEFIQEFGGVSPNAKLVKDADGQIVGVASTKSEVLEKKSPIRFLYDKLPESEKVLLPKQKDDFSIAGYHGTSKSRKAGEPFFDISFGRQQDEFLGEGFYFTLDPKIASEYANMRAINQLVDAGKKDGEGLSIYKPTGQKVTTSSILKGVDVDGKPIPVGQQIAKFDLSNLEKPYVVKTTKDRIYLKENFQKIKDEGYDSVLFDDFKDRSKQIMVFPEHIGKVDEGSGAVDQAVTSGQRYVPKSQNLNLNQANPDIATANSIIENPKLAEEWKSKNSVKQKQKQNPELQKAANDLLDGKITGKQFREKVKTVNPIVPIGKVPPIPSFTDIVGSLLKKQVEKGIYGLNKEIPDGTRVSSRLDIPAYERYDKWIVSIHDSFYKGRKDSIQGEAIAYGKTIVLNNVSFKSLPSRGLRIAAGAEKNTIGRIFGDIKNEAPESVASRAKRHLNEDEWSEIGFNPYRHGFFYNKATGLPVATADEVVQIGPLVLARNAKKMTISEMKKPGAEGLPIRTGKPIEGLKNLKRTKTLFNKGGTIMKEQMELFQEGGLQEEGGTIDPVSGNDVPPGATQEEVRDDIPAQLSEGEFVFPADVVRYIGLEKLMQLRQEAKAGLKRMEEMGQMGNADEATLPDDIPFSVDDLDTREETEEEKIEMAKGGVIEAQAGTFVSPTFGTFAQPSSVVSQFQNTAPNVQLPNTVPMNTGQQIGGFNVPQVGGTQTFQDLVGRNPGQYDEFRKYVNEAGMILNIPFKDGEPLYPVPEGYTFQDPEEVKVEDPSVVNVKPQTARVESVSGDDSPDPEMEAGLGGGRVDIGGQTFATQFDFSGNLIGIANVEDALRTGRADFFAPNPEVKGLITDEIKGNLAKLGGGPFGALGRNLQDKGFLPKSIPLGTETINKGDAASRQLRTYDVSKAGMRPGDMPMKRPSLAELRKGELSAKEIDAKELEDEEKDIAGAGLGKRGIAMKNMGDRADTMSESDFEQAMLEMDRATIEDKFSQDAQNDINLAGGTVSVDLNPNGTSYSKNANGTFTHEDGTTVNFTDGKGNPGNPPPPGDYSEPSYDSGIQDSAFDTTSSFAEGVTESGGMFTAKGGFIKKPKPKVKKMKRGGLASRK